MRIDRRTMIAGSAILAMAGGATSSAVAQEGAAGEMFGLIGKLRAVAGERDALIAILLEGTDDMPGCLSYIVAKDGEDEDAIWITEVWDSRESHRASLRLPQVQAAIARGWPLIAGFESGTEVVPVGGIGLVR